MKKINLILTMSLLVLAAPQSFAQEHSAWPSHESHISMYPNPPQRGLDYILTQTKSMKENQGYLDLTPLTVVNGQGVDAGGALLKYRTYTQCYMTATQIDSRDHHNAFTLKPGSRFLTEEDPETYAKARGEDYIKKIVNDTIPYKYELTESYTNTWLASGVQYQRPRVSIDELKNYCLTNATASRLNPGFCRVLTFKWNAGWKVLDKKGQSYVYSDILNLYCERSAAIVFESDRANFEVSPALVKKTYYISNQEANALLATAGFKLVKALPENIRSKN